LKCIYRYPRTLSGTRAYALASTFVSGNGSGCGSGRTLRPSLPSRATCACRSTTTGVTLAIVGSIALRSILRARRARGTVIAACEFAAGIFGRRPSASRGFFSRDSVARQEINARGASYSPTVSCRVVCRVVSCRVVSCRVVSCLVVSCRVVSGRVMSCRVVFAVHCFGH